MRIIGLDIESEERFGAKRGFLRVRSVRLRNRRDGAGPSEPYVCDFIERPKGIDAVVVAIYRRDGDATSVLLRDGLRPALALGRRADALPIPDAKRYLVLREVVAGIIERGDEGEAGVRRRGAIEVREEAGFDVDADAVVFLGAGTFPSPGSMPEKYHLLAAEVGEDAAGFDPPGDGSPMEEGAHVHWVDLDDAIAGCVRGEIEDAKSELALRRLREWLRGDPAYSASGGAASPSRP